MSRKPETLILLRGLVRESRHWGPFTDLVKELGFNVLTIDLPGVGASIQKSPPLSVFAISEWVRSEALKHSPGPFGLLGVSLGGMVALEWTQNHSKEVTGCMVINTSTSLSPPTKRLRWQVWNSFARLPFMSDVKLREEIITQLVINHPEKQKLAAESWKTIARDFKTHPLAFPNQMIAASRYLPSNRLSGTDQVLVITSDGDRLVDPSCGQLIAERWRWPLHVHPWGGHDLAWDDSDWCLNEVRSFFA